MYLTGWVPFYPHVLTLIPAWISNYIHYNLWDEITSIPKLQRLRRLSLGMDKWFYPTLYWAFDYLYMLGLKLNHISKGGGAEAQSVGLCFNRDVTCRTQTEWMGYNLRIRCISCFHFVEFSLYVYCKKLHSTCTLMINAIFILAFIHYHKNNALMIVWTFCDCFPYLNPLITIFWICSNSLWQLKWIFLGYARFWFCVTASFNKFSGTERLLSPTQQQSKTTKRHKRGGSWFVKLPWL